MLKTSFDSGTYEPDQWSLLMNGGSRAETSHAAGSRARHGRGGVHLGRLLRPAHIPASGVHERDGAPSVIGGTWSLREIVRFRRVRGAWNTPTRRAVVAGPIAFIGLSGTAGVPAKNFGHPGSYNAIKAIAIVKQAWRVSVSIAAGERSKAAFLI